MILSHQRAEQAIAAHATQLTGDLGDTAAELADVFGKLKSSLQVTSGDRDALKVSWTTTRHPAKHCTCARLLTARLSVLHCMSPQRQQQTMLTLFPTGAAYQQPHCKQ